MAVSLYGIAGSVIDGLLSGSDAAQVFDVGKFGDPNGHILCVRHALRPEMEAFVWASYQSQQAVLRLVVEQATEVSSRGV